MVESTQASGFDKMVRDCKLMTVIMFLPLLNVFELVRFCQSNRTCLLIMMKYVNFLVLFEAWGI